jgi:hypothetical protein
MYLGNQPLSASYLTDYFSGNNTTVAFTLSRAPVSASAVIITISGVKQAASTYGVSGTTLTFSGAPPTGTNNIEVLHLGVQPDTVVQPSYRTITEFTATAGQTTFSPASYTAGYIDVYRNGVKLGSADFTATNGTTVVLANACTLGDYVRFEGFLITSFNNAIANTNGAVSASLLATGAAATNIGTAGVTQTMLANNVGSTGPAVFAYGTTNAQTIATSTITKIIFNGKIFDTNNCFDSTTNYRFTPNVAGYYQISFTTQFDYIGSWRAFVYLYKNGSNFLFQEQPNGMAASTYPSLTLNPVLVYANGTTDYFEIYVEQRSGGNQGSYGGGSVPPYSTFFSANMVRAA